MVLPDPARITQLVAKVFNQLQIPYFVSGSLANSLHGIPRATQNVDIVADIKSHHVETLGKI
jgi:threonine aldolase